MTDRELLELAAKAARVYGEFQTFEEYKYHIYGAYGGEGIYCLDASIWNPLMSDGDAFRLAVKMGMHVHVNDDEVFVILPSAPLFAEAVAEPIRSDPCEAARRAIVRSAAEIERGKNNDT